MGFFLPYSSDCCKSTVVVGLFPFQQGKEFHDPVGRFDPPLQKPANFFVIWLIWYTVGWLVGGCGARAVSRKTPIYFMKLNLGQDFKFIGDADVQLRS